MSNAPKTPNKDETIYPKNKDWANFTVNLHDGWADDVSLVYPKESWKPDDDELTKISIDNTVPIEYEDVDEDLVTKRKSKLLSKFSIFLIIWTISLSVVVGILLISYYDYLERYQEAYDKSKPSALINMCCDWFKTSDIDAIYSALTVLPSINEFENELTTKTYIATSISNNNLSTVTASKSSDYTYSAPSYVITNQNGIISNVILRNNTDQTDEFGFPTWYISYFDFDFSPQYKVKITAPKDSFIYINDILVTEDYYYDGTDSEITYLINDFYAAPSIVVFDNNENEMTVLYDEDNDCYEVQ